MRIVSISLLALIFAGAQPASAKQLDSDEIVRALAGNSIVNDAFGCVHYIDRTSGVLYRKSGTRKQLMWDVEHNRYFSAGGRCGDRGCEVTLRKDQITFQRADKRYKTTSTLVTGNVCK